MFIKLSAIANSMGVTYSAFQHFISGKRRSELMCRRFSDYLNLPWEQMRDMPAEKLEVVVVHAYLESNYSWLQDIKNKSRDYENKTEACA
jgi:hypothetical protein